MVSSTLTVLAIAAFLNRVSARTSASCNPLNVTCSADAALGKSVLYDFTKGPSTDWSLSTGSFPTFNSLGAEFSIVNMLDSPTLSSNWYIMFGHYDIVLKAASGQGAISSVVLLSDDLDEIDFEFLGAQDNNVQTNYFGKGITGNYDREITVPVASPQETFHTYSVDWTAEAITWSIDGNVMRTLTPQTADTNQYPQTPMRMKIGTWPSGDPSEPEGVIQWGGGLINYNDGPFTMTVQSVRVVDYSSGTSYSYGNNSGTWQSLQSSGGKINSSGNPNTPASTASMEGFSTSKPTSTPTPTLNPSSTSFKATITSSSPVINQSYMSPPKPARFLE
ncbi:MAG: hypothetical protein LQ340_007113 [Diploschistes diacapsis]|nr:MAG: hypothetical protein LQ340_007113 [Diploschistes diacapsis]